MTDTQNEVFKTPVNKIRLFEHGAPGSQNLKLTRKYYTEDMPDGDRKSTRLNSSHIEESRMPSSA